MVRLRHVLLIFDFPSKAHHSYAAAIYHVDLSDPSSRSNADKKNQGNEIVDVSKRRMQPASQPSRQ
jgi:hypothetical protein